MSEEILGERKKALENEFFAKENQRLLERLRKEREKLAVKEALAQASNIQDEVLLDRLVELEIGHPHARRARWHFEEILS